MSKILYYSSFLTAVLFMGTSVFAQHQAPPPVVKVGKVRNVSESEPKRYIGYVKATDEVDLPARISGFITGVSFKEGSLVKKGDLLFSIEDTSYKARAHAAKAQLDQQSAELSYAVSNFKRQKKLHDKKIVSQSEFEDAKRLIEFKKAKYEQSRAELIDAENNLSYTKIKAPITGRIGEIKYTPGNYVNPSSAPLATIVSVDPIEVKFSVSERDFLNLFKDTNKPNSNLRINIKLANDELYKKNGEIVFVDNKVDSDTGTISIWVSFPNPDLKLIPGGYVTVLISELLKKKEPAVKLSAIMTDIGGNFVYRLDKDNKVVRQPVELGGVVRNLNIIKKGLQPGDIVIISGTNKVRPGMRVKPVLSDQAEKAEKKTPQ